MKIGMENNIDSKRNNFLAFFTIFIKIHIGLKYDKLDIAMRSCLQCKTYRMWTNSYAMNVFNESS